MLKIWVNGFQSDCISKVSAYFDIYKTNEWFNREDVKSIIYEIDNVKVIKDQCLESPIFGGIAPEKLSSGCKALILMQVLDINVFATRCGDNCAAQILRIANEKDLTITLHHCMHFPHDFNAIMLDTGKEVKSQKEFAYEFYRIKGEI